MTKTVNIREINLLKEKSLSKQDLDQNEIKFLVDMALDTTLTQSLPLFQSANEIREKFFANKVTLCSIVNAKSGYCAEDCGFCGQASQFTTTSPHYTLLDFPELKISIHEAIKNGANEFSFVTSGRKISNKNEIEAIAKAIKYIKSNTTMQACSSLGLMSESDLHYLKTAGMDHYHHNLETARSHFSNVISTHSYDDELDVIKSAKKAGLYTCCGGIFGMGESWEQRIELALDLKQLDVDSIPINFLNPISGTPLDELALLTPLEALKIVAIYRFIFPDKNIMVMGGREKVLADLQSWIFIAGANGFLIGNYLITKGRAVEDDLKMIRDLGLVPESHCS